MQTKWKCISCFRLKMRSILASRKFCRTTCSFSWNECRSFPDEACISCFRLKMHDVLWNDMHVALDKPVESSVERLAVSAEMNVAHSLSFRWRCLPFYAFSAENACRSIMTCNLSWKCMSLTAWKTRWKWISFYTTTCKTSWKCISFYWKNDIHFQLRMHVILCKERHAKPAENVDLSRTKYKISW